MADLSGFDANAVPPSSFEPLPAGRYPAAIVESEIKPTKAGTGEYLQLVLEVIDGPYKGRKLWDYVNIRNANAQAQEIALATLSAICRAVGVMTPRDSVELHDLPLTVHVGRDVRPNTGDITNVIKGYSKNGPTVVSEDEPNSTPPWKS